MGRPPLYKPEYCQLLIEHMSNGLSFESFAGVVKACRATIYGWCDNYPEFLDAKKQGFAEMQLHDEKLYIDGMKGKNQKMNPTLMLFKMKNCHNWSEKVEQAVAVSEITINKDDEDL
jgi:hypothetical protein